jgi:hypothetical protein
MDWAPAECTLPAEDLPSRLKAFDELFASALRARERLGPTRLRLLLAGGAVVEATARQLAARETKCCSFFTFTFVPGVDGLALDIEVPAAHAGVLDALAARAAETAPGVAS